MADSADGRNLAGGNGAGYRFFVEAPEIFQRTAAATDDHHVGNAVALGGLNGADNVGRGRFALYGRRVKRDRNGGAATGKNSQYVVYSGAGG